MTAITKAREIVVASYEELNEILFDMQMDGLQIIHIGAPHIMLGSLTFHVQYHVPNLGANIEELPDGVRNNANTVVEEPSQ